MRAVRVVRTRDGIDHPDEATAKRHAEKIYGERLSKVVINLLQYPKYIALHATVEASLDAGIFAELAALRADCALERCPSCKGTGEINSAIGMLTCDRCGGTGDPR